VGCDKFQQKREQFIDEIYRLGNLTEDIIYLEDKASRVDPADENTRLSTEEGVFL
jgi:hypothetical protein